MFAIDWAAECERFKATVGSIDGAAAEAKIPPETLRQLKSVVDELRTNLWAALNATRGGPGENTSLILSMRLQRVQEMCDRVREDVAEGRVVQDIADLGRFVATLGEIERCVRSLLEQTTKSQAIGTE